jgi:hypothetical protein
VAFFVSTRRVGQAGRGIAVKPRAKYPACSKFDPENKADPAPRRPTTVVQFNSRSDRKSSLARWWAGARGGLPALQRLTLNDRPTWRPRDLVPPYEEFQRIAEKEKTNSIAAVGQLGPRRNTSAKTQETPLFWLCLGRWELKRRCDCRSL